MRPAGGRRPLGTPVAKERPNAPPDEEVAVNKPTPAHPTTPPALNVRAFGLTDTGRVRPSNEDSFLIAEMARTLWVRQTNLPQPQTHHGRNRAHLFLVADGMGGHQAGEVASALTLESVEAFVLHLLRRFSNLQADDEAGVVKDFQSALSQADARLFREVALHPEWAGMGTTLTLAFVSGCVLFVVHAGDSRCYLFRGGLLRQLTTDHTIAAELAREGVIKVADIPRSPFRHVVTNVIGGKNVGVNVEVQKVGLKAGDKVLLCSDGLSDMLDDERIARILAEESDPETACARLVAGANTAGGPDNITAVIARFETA
jgi:protein phosphatase